MTPTPPAPRSGPVARAQGAAAGRPGPSVFADVLAALGELDVAQEELRVADEALREYEDQLGELLGRHEAEQRWRDRIAELVPVCQLVTDLAGVVQEADEATARLLATPAERLAAKPLVVFLPVDRRAPWRAALSELVDGHEEVRVALTLQPRGGPETTVDAVGVLERADQRVRWVLLPASLSRSEGTRDRPVGAAQRTGGRGSSVDDLEVASAVARLCRVPVGVEDPQLVVSRLAASVRDAVPSATWASVTVGSPADPERQASDSVAAQQLDGLMDRVGEGPALAAHASGDTVVVGDLRADDRFPRLAALAGGGGARSVLGLPVSAGSHRLGVLTVSAAEPDAFGDRDRRIGELVAATVAAVLEQLAQRQSLRSLTEHLTQALSSRAVIEQAKGIVMAHHGGTPDDAFARLVALSNRHNVKLRDLAALLVEGGARQGLDPWLTDEHA